MANPTKWYREETITVRNQDEEGQLSEKFQPLNEEDAEALQNGAIALIVIAMMAGLMMGVGGLTKHTAPVIETNTEYRN